MPKASATCSSSGPAPPRTRGFRPPDGNSQIRPRWFIESEHSRPVSRTACRPGKRRPQRNAAAARWGILGISVKESSARRAIAVDSITGSGVISPGGQRRTPSPDRFLTFSSTGSRRSRPSPTRVRSPATGCTCRSSRCGRPNRSSAGPRPWPRRSPPGRCPPFRRSGGK